MIARQLLTIDVRLGRVVVVVKVFGCKLDRMLHSWGHMAKFLFCDVLFHINLLALPPKQPVPEPAFRIFPIIVSPDIVVQKWRNVVLSRVGDLHISFGGEVRDGAYEPVKVVIPNAVLVSELKKDKLMRGGKKNEVGGNSNIQSAIGKNRASALCNWGRGTRLEPDVLSQLGPTPGSTAS